MGQNWIFLLKCRYKKRTAASKSEEDCSPVSFLDIVMSQNGAATRSYTYLDANWSVLRLCGIGFITILGTVAKFRGKPDWVRPAAVGRRHRIGDLAGKILE